MFLKIYELMKNKIIKAIVGVIFFGFSTFFVLGESAEFEPLFSEDSLSEWESIGPAKWRVTDGTLITGQDGDPKRWGMLQSYAGIQWRRYRRSGRKRRIDSQSSSPTKARS